MTWQELLVGVIVGLAVVSLYRHLRGLVGNATSDSATSCHNCDECETGATTAPLDQPTAIPLPPQSPRAH